MSELFEKTNIKSMHLSNRIVRSATFERMFDKDGFPQPELSTLYEKLAKGGTGLIITGYATISDDISVPFSARIDNDKFISKYKSIIDKVHEYSCCIAMQINHPGRQTTKMATGNDPVAPSAVKCKFPPSLPREMTEEDIERVINDFLNAAIRVKESGFDAVQIQAGHGMLINQFLAPYTNLRKDKWGGSLENRIRFLKEIYTRCRTKLGDEYPILVKLNAYDNMKMGLKLEEGIKIAEIISEMGFDGMEVSCGIFEDGLSTLCGNFPVNILIDEFHSFDNNPVLRFFMRHFGRKLIKIPDFSLGYNKNAAILIKKKVNIPVFTVGGMHDPKGILYTIEKGEVDYISLCRPLIADHNFPLKIKDGNLNPSKCIKCNYCFIYTVMKAPLKCYFGKSEN